MSRRGFIRAEDLHGQAMEAYPYFPVNPLLALDGEKGFEADSMNPDGTPVTLDDRITSRLQHAEREAQEIARRAYEEGFASGEAEGRAFGESQYKSYIQRLEQHLAELSTVTLSLQGALGDEWVALSLAVGEHLAVQQIEQSHGAVRAFMERVLEELPFPLPRGRREGEMPMQVFLNPADLAQLGSHYAGHAGLNLQADAALSRGSLRIEAPQGILNGTLERRRERLLQLITRMKEGAP